MPDDTTLPPVTLVIPVHNGAGTMRACLDAATRIVGHDGLSEILVVDDGSTDGTTQLLEGYPVRRVVGRGQGAAAARNVGWQTAQSPLIWFIDADCVPQLDALRLLLGPLNDPQVAAVGGSYENMCPQSLLACLIHEEIIERHLLMGSEVNVLATFNVVYRRAVLEQLGGFDGSYAWAHDAELAFRVRRNDYTLRFEPRSRVGHFHPIRWHRYFRKQLRQGYWRVRLYLRHPRRVTGDSYSGWTDFAQPILAVLLTASLPLLWWPPWRWLVASLAIALVLAPLPMTIRIVRRKRQWRYLAYLPMSLLRAFWRGAGMSLGLIGAIVLPPRRGARQ